MAKIPSFSITNINCSFERELNFNPKPKGPLK